ncbi:tetratricopeptide repeat protein [Paenibacillus thiaminolyticus]|uniref:tetratricopeptide repeat protein n=1 Tax=Paenibacillus thiaminolyticus TaxID=49283 RepID=UPI0035A5D84E
MTSTLTIPYNMNFVFDEALHEKPIDTEDMNRGIDYLKKQFTREPTAGTAGLIGTYSRIVNDFDNAKKYLTIAIKLNKSRNNERGVFANKIRLANTYQWNKEYAEADILFHELEEEIATVDISTREIYEDFLYQHFGKNKFDQEQYEEALIHFNKALQIRLNKGNQELIQSTTLAIDTTRKKINMTNVL